MSEENRQLIGRVLRRLNEEGVEGILAEIDPQATADVSNSEAPDRGVYHGHAGWRTYMQNRSEAFDEVQFEILELIDVPPDKVISVGRMQGRGRGSGIDVESHATVLWTVKGGKVGAMKLYQTRAEALEDVGLEA
jgi:ketosteroid isomerase-like protein